MSRILIFALYKGVPSDIAKVATAGGIIKREEAQLVINPYDVKAIEAADYLRRLAGGKVISISMGPHQRVIPIASTLYSYEVWGVDESYILSDRRMAGADTRATAYTLSMGIKKIIDIHRDAVTSLIASIEEGRSDEEIKKIAEDLYSRNLIPNKIYSNKPSISKYSLIERYISREISREKILDSLREYRENLYRDIVLFLGMKAVDGETGNTGPQLSQALSDRLGIPVAHATYVTNFTYDPVRRVIMVRRRMGRVIQDVEMDLPALLTIRPEYEAPPTPISRRLESLMEMYKGKITEIKVLNADDIGADLRFIGLLGSPTQVGPTIEVPKMVVKRIVGRSIKILKEVEKIEVGGVAYGPYKPGDIITNPSKELAEALVSQGLGKIYDYDDLADDIVKILSSETSRGG
ncbi:MAG: hypothetical protein QXE68_03075 [Sulfolobales archaeon]